MKMQSLSSDVERQHVVAGDDDVAAGHDQHDREQAGDRQRVARGSGPGPSRPSPEAACGVHVLGDPVGVDDRDEPVERG